jgi:hypothetical protein
VVDVFDLDVSTNDSVGRFFGEMVCHIEEIVLKDSEAMKSLMAILSEAVKSLIAISVGGRDGERDCGDAAASVWLAKT